MRYLPVFEEASGQERIPGRFKNCKSNHSVVKLKRTKVGFATVMRIQNDQEIPEAQSGARYARSV